MDEIRLPTGRAKPEPHQPENWELAAGQWQLVRRPAGSRAHQILSAALYTGTSLLESTSDSVLHSLLQQHPASASLAVLRPRNLEFYKKQKMFGGSQPRAVFEHGGYTYDLSVTDPIWKPQVLQLGAGRHPAEQLLGRNQPYLTVSLSEPFKGQCYKLVAAVFALPRG